MRNREITETLERERNALASEHGKLTSMLSQTQARISLSPSAQFLHIFYHLLS